MNKLLTSAAMVGVLMAASTASAADAAPKVKCYGIAKAGKNDCKSANGSHSCAGLAKTDNDANEWNNTASAEECTKAGGKVDAPVAAATPAAASQVSPAAGKAEEAPAGAKQAMPASQQPKKQ